MFWHVWRRVFPSDFLWKGIDLWWHLLLALPSLLALAAIAGFFTLELALKLS
jgi:hypothetical protein